MAKRSIKFYTVDAFAESPFTGNPAAVLIFDKEPDDEEWMRSVAREFNLSATCFVTKINDSSDATVPKFRLRWLAPAAELNICGHGSIASSFVLFSKGFVQTNTLEFHTNSGVMLVEKIPITNNHAAADHEENNNINGTLNGNVHKQEQFSIQLAFPLIPVIPVDSSEQQNDTFPKSLLASGASVDNIVKMSYEGELIVELPSSSVVSNLQPSFEEIQKWPGRGVVVTGAAPPESGFDFYSRFFCPNLGMREDPVCGSVHCGLAPYWSKKLGKTEFKAYMASPRGGSVDLKLDEANKKVYLRGKAALVMEGLLLA